MEENVRLGREREREGDDAEAVRLYRLAADEGDADAQYTTGAGGNPHAGGEGRAI